jgi:Ca2+-binding EF-hand superfamily protein
MMGAITAPSLPASAQTTWSEVTADRGQEQEMTLRPGEVASAREDSKGTSSPVAPGPAEADRADYIYVANDEEMLEETSAEAPAVDPVSTVAQRIFPPRHRLKGGQQSTDTLCDIRCNVMPAANFQEALDRLRHYLLRQYGSYMNAFAKLESSGDMTGMMGGQASVEGGNLNMSGDVQTSGVMHMREFMTAVTNLIPNWAAVTGCGKLKNLFKSMDTNGSGYVNFHELMGVPMDHPLSRERYFHRTSAHQCMFRQRAEVLWNISQNRTNGCAETFGATMRHRNMDRLMLNLAPLFTPIHEMELRVHDDEDDGRAPSMTSDAHSSEQELDLEHIRLRLRAAGWTNHLNWRKMFHHYDHRNTGEISWHEFRSIVRKDAQINQSVLTERDLTELFYHSDHEILDMALGHGIVYDKMLEWLEPEPTEEEKILLRNEQDAITRHANCRRTHKTALIRKLEMERRIVAADHHSHMSCNPCTKLCPICMKVILVSSWAAHAHGCARKARVAREKEQELDEMQKTYFKPWISARAAKTDSTFTQAANKQEMKKKGFQLRQPRFPLRDKKIEKHKAEHHERCNAELSFKPEINERSRHIHRMVHENDLDTGFRLMNTRPAHRILDSQKREEQGDPGRKVTVNEPEAPPVEEFVPQITVRGVQKGLERAGCSIFHRLHHGPPETAVFVDPGAEISEDAVVHHQTKHVMRVKKPIGLNAKSWEKVKTEQYANFDEMVARRKDGDADSTSPASTGFPDDGAVPMSPDLYTPQPYSARSGATSSGKQTPSGDFGGGGIRALSGKIRQSISLQAGDRTGLPLTLMSPDSTTSEVRNPPHVLVGTERVMGLLSRCHRAVQVSAKMNGGQTAESQEM